MSQPDQLRRRPWPWATTSILLLTSVVTVAGLVWPEIRSALERNAHAIRDGEWWRLATSLLVHEKAGHFAFNSVALVIFGLEAERLFGRRWFFVLYAVGGLAGELAGLAWKPLGAGSSVAVCGLIGGILAASLAGKAQAGWIARGAALCLVMALAGEAAFGLAGGVVLCAFSGFLLPIARRREVATAKPDIFVSVVALLGAVALVVLRDIHGPAVLAGAVAVSSFKFRVSKATANAE
jgi:membrane associated rhomboid family serine protease